MPRGVYPRKMRPKVLAEKAQEPIYTRSIPHGVQVNGTRRHYSLVPNSWVMRLLKIELRNIAKKQGIPVERLVQTVLLKYVQRHLKA